MIPREICDRVVALLRRVPGISGGYSARTQILAVNATLDRNEGNEQLDLELIVKQLFGLGCRHLVERLEGCARQVEQTELASDLGAICAELRAIGEPATVRAAYREPPRLALADHRRSQLANALQAAFPEGPAGLRTLASYYAADGLPDRLPEGLSLDGLARRIVDVADASVLESLLRSARRSRPALDALARAINDVWPLADGLDFGRTDQLLRRLIEANISYEVLRKAVKSVVGADLPPLWAQRGPEPHGDLVEGVAQLSERPLKLVRVAEQFREYPGVAAWLDDVAAQPGNSRPSPCRLQRMLLVLRRGVNDNYHGDIYFGDGDGRPRFVAALREQAPLANIAGVFAATRRENDDLRGALLDLDPQLIEVMLPVRDLLTRVEQWDLLGSGAIGELFPVVVRPLERAFAMQFDDYVGGAILHRKSWEAVQRAPAMKRLELEPAQVSTAVLQHPTQWCVAAFRCPDPTQPDRLLEIDRLVRRGVAAMLTVRHEQGWPEHITAACSLPTAVHDHRREWPTQPVMLLWDDANFNPGRHR